MVYLKYFSSDQTVLGQFYYGSMCILLTLKVRKSKKMHNNPLSLFMLTFHKYKYMFFCQSVSIEVRSDFLYLPRYIYLSHLFEKFTFRMSFTAPYILLLLEPYFSKVPLLLHEENFCMLYLLCVIALNQNACLTK